MTVLIAGATGLVGAEALRLLLGAPEIREVVSVTRKSLPSNPKLKQVIISFDALANETLPQADVALCALGSTIKTAGSQQRFYRVDHDYVLDFAKAAKRAAVKKFIVVSALGADENSSIFYNRTKGETERDLKALGFESLVILQPSLLLGTRRETRTFERLAVKFEPIYRTILIGPLAKYQPVHATQVAKTMVSQAILTNTPSRTLSNLEILEGN